MAELSIVFIVVFLCGFIWSTQRLWRIYAMGTNLYFSYVFKPAHIHSREASLQRLYTWYQVKLWLLWTVTGIGAAVALVMIINTK